MECPGDPLAARLGPAQTEAGWPRPSASGAHRLTIGRPTCHTCSNDDDEFSCLPLNPQLSPLSPLGRNRRPWVCRSCPHPTHMGIPFARSQARGPVTSKSSSFCFPERESRLSTIRWCLDRLTAVRNTEEGPGHAAYGGPSLSLHDVAWSCWAKVWALVLGTSRATSGFKCGPRVGRVLIERNDAAAMGFQAPCRALAELQGAPSRCLKAPLGYRK